MAFLRSDVNKTRKQVILTVSHRNTTATYAFDRSATLSDVLTRVSDDLGVGPKQLVFKATVKPDAQQIHRF